MLQIT
ncbi:hypothetical protein YPPY19_1703, partial [Yersinia pestis PY-19]